MTGTQTILAAHIALGPAGLLLGPIVMAARKRPGLHTLGGELYHWLMLGVCVSAGLLSLWEWSRLWAFFWVALFSYAFALKGYLAAKIRWKGWLTAHIGGMGGSYIAMVTALLVVNREKIFTPLDLPHWLAWVLPTLVGSPLLAFVISKISRQKG